MIPSLRLDPRAKLVIVICISTLAVFLEKLSFMLALLVATLLVAWLFQLHSSRSIGRIKKVLSVIIFIAMLQSLFTNAGTPLLSIGHITIISTYGLQRGVGVLLRISIIVLSAALLTTSSSRDIVQGLIQWKMPYELAFMVSIGIRFLPLLAEEIQDTFVALQLRGVELKKIPMKRKIKTYSYLLMPMVSSVLIKGRELSMAMELRAFRAYPERSSLRTLKMKHMDYAFILLSLSLTSAVFYIYMHY